VVEVVVLLGVEAVRAPLPVSCRGRGGEGEDKEG